MLKVAGKPILFWQIEWLKAYGVKHIILCVGYLREVIMKTVGDGTKLGVLVEYAIEEEPLGTGGGLKNAKEFVRDEDYFLALNGDVITNLNPLKLVSKIREGYVGVLALVQLPSPYGIVQTDFNGRVKAFIEKPLLPEYWINAGVYCLTPDAFNYLPDKGDIERIGFPEMARDGKLASVKYVNVYWHAIDTFKDLESVSNELKERKDTWPGRI